MSCLRPMGVRLGGILGPVLALTASLTMSAGVFLLLSEYSARRARGAGILARRRGWRRCWSRSSGSTGP